MKLDRNRRYGIVYGDPVKCYYQDGVFFDGQGRAVGAASREEPEPASEPVAVVERDDSKAKRIATLEKVHVTKLKHMAEQLAEQLDVKLPKMSGKGVKAKLVAWIADNTTD